MSTQSSGLVASLGATGCEGNPPAHKRPAATGSPIQPETTGRSRLRTILEQGGLLYSLAYCARTVLNRAVNRLDRRLVMMEQHRCLVQPWTISAKRFTAAENRQLWNGYDWSRLGEEWTKSDEWKERVVREWLLPYFPEGGVFLEIGPGGGRWTEVLQPRAKYLHLIDVAETAIRLCRTRFAHCTNVAFLVGNGRTIDLPAASIDGIWSYDVFVHITPLDVKSYFNEFSRVLRPGGCAVVHHAGSPIPGQMRRPGWRSDLTDRMVWLFSQEAGLQLVAQTEQLVNPGDLLTVFRKPSEADCAAE